jgi:glucose/arabinose dehydrogenase
VLLLALSMPRSCCCDGLGLLGRRSHARSFPVSSLPKSCVGGAFAGEHGSWNRQVLNAYKVVVGVAIDKSGALLIADDVGNTVWRVTSPTSS